MLFILEPLSFVSHTVCLVVNTVTVRLVVFPLAVVDVPVCVNQTTTSVSFVVQTVPLVQRSVSIDLNASAVLTTLFVPLTSVLSAIL